MPELPEVETLKRELSRAVVGLDIKNCEILWAKTVSPLSPKKFTEQIQDKKIVGVRRRAKMLFLDLEGNHALAIHLKMTGQLIYSPRHSGARNITGGHPDEEMLEKQPSKYTRLIFEFTDRSKLYFNDLRKFGWVRFVTDKEMKKLIEKIGPEPLSTAFTSNLVTDIFKKNKNKSIKQILLDQTLIAGIGNIYADESCFLSKLKPDRKAHTLKPGQIKNLRDNIIKVLKLSIQKKGTSSRNYRRSDGTMGGFVPHLNVYGREGEPCKVCHQPVQKTRHAGRGTHFCPRCQK